MAKGSYCHAKGSNLFTGEVGGPIRAADPYSTVRYKFNDAAQLPLTHEGLTFERDAVRREPFAQRSSYFVNELTDDLSIEMVRRIQNRYGVEIWPWERTGFTTSHRTSA